MLTIQGRMLETMRGKLIGCGEPCALGQQLRLVGSLRYILKCGRGIGRPKRITMNSYSP
jgi:hypothetical protein